MPQFASSPRSTVGIEWELALIDARTRELVPHAPAILSALTVDFPETKFPHAAAELLTNTVELVSAPHHTVRDAVADLCVLARSAAQAAQAHGALLIGSGSHPFSTWQEQQFTACERYDRFAERYQWWGRNMLIWGVHVHVGVDRPEHAVPLMHALLTCLPHLLAVSASSPFWAGEATQYVSNRTLIFQQLPSAGLPPDVDTWEDLEQAWAEMTTAGIISDPTEARWDVRPAPQWGTVEVRICDGATSLADIGMIAAFTQCLAEYFQVQAAEGAELPRLPQWCVRENKWRAARFGLDADIITNATGEQESLRTHLADLLTRLAPIAERLGCARELSLVAHRVASGTSAERQLAVYRSHGAGRTGLLAVADSLSQEFAQGLSPE